MNILTDQDLAERRTKKEANLEWWEAKLAKPRKASLIGIRSAYCAMLRKEIAELKNIQFARHCAEQV